MEKQLINSDSEWATSLLYHYAGKISEIMDNKYKTFNWNIEMNLQEEALRSQAIRECCLSDSMKEDLIGSGADDLNVSSSEEKDD